MEIGVKYNSIDLGERFGLEIKFGESSAKR